MSIRFPTKADWKEIRVRRTMFPLFRDNYFKSRLVNRTINKLIIAATANKQRFFSDSDRSGTFLKRGLNITVFSTLMYVKMRWIEEKTCGLLSEHFIVQRFVPVGSSSELSTAIESA